MFAYGGQMTASFRIADMTLEVKVSYDLNLLWFVLNFRSVYT